MRHPRRRTAAIVLVVPLALSGALAGSADAKTRKLPCQTGLQLTQVTRTFETVESYRFTNRTSIPQKTTYTSTVTKERGVTDSKGVEASVGGGFGPFSASVKGQMGQEVSESSSVTKGVAYEVVVPGRRKMVFRIGFNVLKVRGYVLVDPNTPYTGVARPVRGLPPGCTLKSVETINLTAPQEPDVRYLPMALKKKRR